MTATEYLHRKDTLLNTPYVLKGGRMYAIYQGREIPEEVFMQIFKLPDRLYTRPNPNKKTEALR